MYDLKQEAKMLKECIEWADEKLDMGFTEKLNSMMEFHVSTLLKMQDMYEYSAAVKEMLKPEIESLTELLDSAEGLSMDRMQWQMEQEERMKLSPMEELNTELDYYIASSESDDDDEQQKVLSLRLGR